MLHSWPQNVCHIFGPQGAPHKLQAHVLFIAAEEAAVSNKCEFDSKQWAGLVWTSSSTSIAHDLDCTYHYWASEQAQHELPPRLSSEQVSKLGMSTHSSTLLYRYCCLSVTICPKLNSLPQQLHAHLTLHSQPQNACHTSYTHMQLDFHQNKWINLAWAPPAQTTPLLPSVSDA